MGESSKQLGVKWLSGVNIFQHFFCLFLNAKGQSGRTRGSLPGWCHCSQRLARAPLRLPRDLLVTVGFRSCDLADLDDRSSRYHQTDINYRSYVGILYVYHTHTITYIYI